jgi:hypothetical protein
VESRLGDGAVVLAAFPAHTRWTSLPTRPDFTPLVMQLANHVARRPGAEAPSAVSADGAAEFSVSGAWGDVAATVKTPSGRVVEQSFERVGPRLLGTFTETAERGYYTLDVKSTRPEPSKAAELAFAVNLSPDESDFTFLGEQQVRDLLPTAALTWADASADVAKVRSLVTDETTLAPREAWIALLLAVIASEFFLATWGGRRKKIDEETTPASDRVHGAAAGSWVGRLTGARGK